MERRRADLAASYQRAISDSLIARSRQALRADGRAPVGAGRRRCRELGGAGARRSPLDVELWIPERALCTDNAAMIAAVARFSEPLPYPDYLALDAYRERPRDQPS